MGIEQFNQLGEIGQGAGQAIDFIDDNDIDPVGSNVSEELLVIIYSRCRSAK